MERRKLHTQEEVGQLLEKFMAGTTTLEEEAQLAEFFRTHEVAGEWSTYKEMFALFDEGKVAVEEEKKSKGWWKYAGIAAAVVLLLSLGFFLFHTNHPEKPELMAQTDSIQTAPEEEQGARDEEPETKQKPVEKVDTVRKVKEIQRIARPPKQYMAKAEKKDVQPKQEVGPDSVVFGEATIININIPLEGEVAVEYAGYSIRPHNQYELPSEFEDVKCDIQKRGEQLNQVMELAMSDESY